MIAACFARALQRCTDHLDTGFLLIFQAFKPIRKTRNQVNTDTKYDTGAHSPALPPRGREKSLP
jgi:hypothetical protein